MLHAIINGINRQQKFAMVTAATKNFHLPMPVALYTGLREAAARAGTPATDVAREAIQAWLNEDRRRQQRTELAEFEEANAGSAWDRDPQWEAAGLEITAKLPHWPDSSQSALSQPTGSAGRRKNPTTHPKDPLKKRPATRSKAPT